MLERIPAALTPTPVQLEEKLCDVFFSLQQWASFQDSFSTFKLYHKPGMGTHTCNHITWGG